MILFSVGMTTVAQRALVERQVFDQFDIVFHSDPNYHSVQYAHGRLHWNPRHPLAPWLVSVPLKVVGKIILAVRGEEFDDAAWRDRAVMALMPTAAGARSLILLLLLAYAGIAAGPRIGIAMLEVTSYTTRLLGGIIETFPISVLLMTTAGLLMVLEVRSRRRLHPLIWLGLGMVLVGITVTNVMALCAAAFASELALREGRRWWRVLVRPAALGVVTLAGVYAAGWLLTGYTGMWRGVLGVRTGVELETFGGAVAGIAQALGSVFLGQDVVAVTNPFSVEQGFPISVSLVFGDAFRLRDALGFLGCVALVTAGAIGWWRRGELGRTVLTGFGLILAANVGIHLFFGHYYFLYSPHWLVPILVIAAGAAYWDRLGRAALPVAAAVAAGMLVWNLGPWGRMLAMIDELRAGSPTATPTAALTATAGLLVAASALLVIRRVPGVGAPGSPRRVGVGGSDTIRGDEPIVAPRIHVHGSAPQD